MIRSPYQYFICMFQTDYTAIGQVPVEVDWTPAVEWAYLCGLRRGDLAPGESRRESQVTPIWHPTSGRPFAEEVRATVRGAEGGQASCTLKATEYFKSLARAASAVCIREGKLPEGDTFWYAVSATDVPPVAETGGRTLRLEEVDTGPTLGAASRADFAGELVGADQEDPRDLPLYVPQGVLDETADLAARAGETETGGVLIGHLHRDPETHELFLEVTAQIPARQAKGELTRLTFTAESWTPIRAAMQLRNRKEIMVGWWHSHSFLKKTCLDCQKRKEGKCRASAAYLSSDDCDVHRRCYPRAYSVALVVADSPCSGLSWSFFGWREGAIQPRTYYLTGRASAQSRTQAPDIHRKGEPTHAS